VKADLRDAAIGTVAIAGPSKPSDRASIRRGNLGLVLRLLRDSGPRSRSRIAPARWAGPDCWWRSTAGGSAAWASR